MISRKNDSFGLNDSYVEILRSQWIENPLSVPKEWREFFEGVSEDIVKSPALDVLLAPQTRIAEDEQAMSGINKKIAENMIDSISLPTATSFRSIPVKVLEENRLVINQFLFDDARPRCSYTHIIAYALVKALKKIPSMNNCFLDKNGNFIKRIKSEVNLGIAVDVINKDKERILLVPNIKNAHSYNFFTFYEKYNDIVNRAQNNKLNPEDFLDTSITLTNPGGIGTQFSSPRLMKGQGVIIATGKIGYPSEYESASLETIQSLGIGKVMTMSSTYDHRIIQGAESGMFLAYMHELLIGDHEFYEEIFGSLKIPHKPFALNKDMAVYLGQKALVTHTERAMKVSQLIHSYRVRGYLLAHVDPLHLIPQEHHDLNLSSYNLTIWDLDRHFETLDLLQEKSASLREILEKLRNTYCRRIGVEYMYINDLEQRNWLRSALEQENDELSSKEKINVLSDLVRAEGIEHFLHKRFVGHKRFSIEGAEVIIPSLRELLDQACMHEVSDIVIGMAHRGRLNVLTNIVGKPYEAIFAEFDDIDPKTIQGSGDVKYHLGAKGIHRFISNVKGVKKELSVKVELACNPSHLESVNPVVEGVVRARQDASGDRLRDKVIPVLIHGDAAFACQGVVYETLQLSNLKGYRTGGTIHIVINNQIGYTTPPEKARTSSHCSDIAKVIEAPVFHVNGDSPEACIRAIRLAFNYRMQFKRDVILDIVCYRRHGHNEGDEPSFTQPILYQAIKNHPSVAKIYAEFLLRRNDLSKTEIADIENKFNNKLEEALSLVREKGRAAFSKEHLLAESDAVTSLMSPDTSIKAAMLNFIAERTTHDPKNIELHPRVVEQTLHRRRAMLIDKTIKIDFGAAEILAYGSLLLDGIAVRLSGQDCGRGTFAHRHAVLYDVNDGSPYIPLNHLKNSLSKDSNWYPSRFRVYDSPLSEEAVLGFEYGYSVSHPSSLVIWEAQFGDFFNNAQVIVDQFIASSESKWGQKSRLTMLLPHGYDGQGPEHSSARIERYLELCAHDNIRVCNVTTPAQLFHLLRRQAKLKKKPLIIFTHKSLLRAEDAASSVDDFITGGFNHVIAEDLLDKRKSINRLILMSGKIYWELKRFHIENKIDLSKIRLVRIEELYPFPKEALMSILAEKNVGEIVWLQEEPRNNGAYLYIKDQFNQMNIAIKYIGRAESSSPATGSPKIHKNEQVKLLEFALALDKLKNKSEVVV